MATRRRSESFRHALGVLRSRLAGGAYPPETRLAAADLAAELGLSPTPMREVLARFVGEGLLVDRPGQGVFVPRHSAREIADLYRLSLAHVQIALQTRPAGDGVADRPRRPTPRDAESAIAAADALLGRWVMECGSPLLARAYGRLQRQLAPVRRVEGQVLNDLAVEYAGLAAQAGLSAAQRLARVRGYFRRRIRNASRLAERLEPRLSESQILLTRELE